MTADVLVRVPARSLGAAFRIGLERSIRQRSAVFMVALFYLMVVGVLAAVWLEAIELNGGSVVGYNAVAMVWYIATAEAAVNALPVRLVEEVGDDLGSGRVVTEMLRPAPVLAVRLAGELGRSLPRLLACGIAGTGLALVVVGPPPDALGVALAIPAILVAVTVNLVGQYLFAAMSFWIRETKTGWFIYQKLVFILGGMLLPLEVLPSQLETVTKALPFMAVAYAPARLASGHVEPSLLLVQIAWLLALIAFTWWVFAAGERRLVEEGR